MHSNGFSSAKNRSKEAKWICKLCLCLMRKLIVFQLIRIKIVQNISSSNGLIFIPQSVPWEYILRRINNFQRGSFNSLSYFRKHCSLFAWVIFFTILRSLIENSFPSVEQLNSVRSYHLVRCLVPVDFLQKVNRELILFMRFSA